MRKGFLLSLFAAVLCLCFAVTSECSARMKKLSIAEPFEAYELIDGLDSPWNIDYGPDGMLWVTERMGKRIVRIDPKTGNKKVAVTIDEVLATGGQQGIFGMAMQPGFLKAGANNYLYVFYTYKPSTNSPENGYKKLVRYQYDAKEQILKNPVDILDRLPAGTDHNGGRVVYGPDGMIYISVGELGHNQNANYTLPIEAQRLPTVQEMAANDYAAYVGKVLRLMPDGTIPPDNPVLNVVRSHIYTLGHRNPQGLVFAENNLYACEHGPSTDDELNLIEAGGNYGWPHIAGFQDDMAYVYANWSKAPNKENLTFDANIPGPGVPVQKETDWVKPDNYKDPLKTFYTVRNDYNFHAGDNYGDLGYAVWPTIAPSSLAYYPAGGPIKGWENSILITALKNGAIYKVKLDSTKTNVQGDVEKLFKTQNRYRDLCLSPDNKTIYVITDPGGTSTTVDGLVPTDKVENPGAILVFTYTGR